MGDLAKRRLDQSIELLGDNNGPFITSELALPFVKPFNHIG